jgi:uncharacterized protein
VPTDNIELIRGGYVAWNRGDVESVAAILDEEVEWHGHPRLPEPGPYFGRDAVKRWLISLRSAWESISVHPLAFAESGDMVVVLVHITGQGRGSGVAVQSGVDAHVWEVADRRVIGMRWLQGDEAARRAGLSVREREVLRLRGAHDLSDSEIADRLGLSAAEVGSVAGAALGKLPLLAGEGHE